MDGQICEWCMPGDAEQGAPRRRAANASTAGGCEAAGPGMHWVK
jgi:hypothetical protein